MSRRSRGLAALLTIGGIGVVAFLLIKRIDAARDPKGSNITEVDVWQTDLSIVAIAVTLTAGVLAWWRRGDTTSARWFSPFGSRYRSYLEASTRHLNMQSLTLAHPMHMDVVYVDVSLTLTLPGLARPGLVATANQDRRRSSIRDFLQGDERAVVVVVGGPGCGKSTLLRHVVRSMTRAPRHRRRAPVLIELRQHAAAFGAGQRPSLLDLWRAGLGELGRQEPRGWLATRLQRGGCLVAVDGLDEVLGNVSEVEIRDWAEQQINLYPRNDFVFTSRPIGYREAPIANATTLEVRHLTAPQIRAIVAGLMENVTAFATDGRPDRPGPDELLSAVQARPELIEYCTNPLLLTLIVLSFVHHRRLPDNRADLYADICTSALTRRRHPRATPDIRASAQAILDDLAFTMMQVGAREVDHTALANVVRRVLDKPSPADVEHFIAAACDAGIIVEPRRARYGFAHATLQDYCAARFIADHKSANFLVDRIQQSWWHETILIYAHLADPKPLIQACLHPPTHDSLSLAFEILAATATNDDVLVAELRSTVDDAFMPTASSSHRRSIAHALLRHATRRVSLPIGDLRLCLEPVSREVYTLFLLDTGRLTPDAVRNAHRAATPTTGLWPHDAVAFAAWANDSTADIRYALPTPTLLSCLVEEFDLPSFRQRTRNVYTWASPDNTAADPTVSAEPIRCTLQGIAEPAVLDGKQLARWLAPHRPMLWDLTIRLLRLHAVGLAEVLAQLHAQQVEPSRSNLVARAVASRYLDSLVFSIEALRRCLRDPSLAAQRSALRPVPVTESDLGTTRAVWTDATVAHTARSHLLALHFPEGPFSRLDDITNLELSYDTSALADRMASVSNDWSSAVYRAMRYRMAHGRPSGVPQIGTDEQVLDRFARNDNDRAGDHPSATAAQFDKISRLTISAVQGSGTEGWIECDISERQIRPSFYSDPVETLLNSVRRLVSTPIRLAAASEPLTLILRQHGLNAPVAQQLASMVDEIGGPILQRRRPALENDAARVVICAAVIACEAQQRDLPELADVCWRTAVTTAELGLRTAGRTVAREQLFLAVE